MRDIRQKNWFWIENELIDREDLGAYEKLLYMALARYCDTDGKCFPGLDLLMKSSGIGNKRTLTKHLRNLEEKGLIEIVKRNGKGNLYYLKNASTTPGADVSPVAEMTRVKSATTPGADVPLHRGQNCHPNNTQEKNSIKKTQLNIYSRVVDYLNKKINSSYKSNSSKTKELIKARLNDGFIFDDFVKVIDNKCLDWKNTEFEKYLRPITLFGTKFEDYLNQKINQKEEKNGSSRQNSRQIQNKHTEEVDYTDSFKDWN